MKNRIVLTSLLALIVLTGCSFPGAVQPSPTPPILPTPTLIVPTPPPPTATISPVITPTATVVFFPSTAAADVGEIGGVTPVPAATFCSDAQVTALLDSLKTALQTSNGTLLASLVSPVHGMEVRYYRDGRTVIYDKEHAHFLFTSTWQVDWGDAPGSGLPSVGAFHQVILPDLLKLFNSTYTLACNQVQVGGATYQASWPYSANFYSVYYGGTTANGNMDWLTWLVGFEYVNGRPYLYALLPYRWEP